MIKVCGYFHDTILLIGEFETKEEAEEFMQHDYLVYYADETANAEDEWICTCDMFIDSDDIPFNDPFTREELPF